MKVRYFPLLFLIFSLLLTAVPVKAETSYYAMSFDGVNDYVEVADNPSLNSDVVTVAVLMHNRETRDEQMAISKGKYGIGGWYWWVDSRRWRISLTHQEGVSHHQSGYYVPTGKWTFLASVIDSNAKILKFYVNGELYTTGTIEGFIPPTEINLKLGSYSNGGYYWNGSIGYVYMYNRALSDSEIQAIYNDPNNPPLDGLVLWFAPDSVDVTNGKWLDKSGNNNHGTIYGATPVQQSLVKVYDYNTGQDISINSTIKDLDDNVTLLSSLALIDYGVPKTLEVRANGYIPIVGTVSGGKTTYAFYLRPMQTPVITQNELNSQNAVGIGINFGFKLLYYGVGAMILFGVFGIAGEEAQRKMAIILAGALGLVFFIYMLLMV